MNDQQRNVGRMKGAGEKTVVYLQHKGTQGKLCCHTFLSRVTSVVLKSRTEMKSGCIEFRACEKCWRQGCIVLINAYRVAMTY
jgi:hypothetical protein